MRPAILRVIKPIWSTTPVFARAALQRIEAIFDAAAALGHRQGSNLARWGNHLEHLLSKPSGDRRRHAALAYAKPPAFAARLREVEGIAARALEFTMLTAARTRETTRDDWREIDLEARLWAIPAERMKGWSGRMSCRSATALRLS